MSYNPETERLLLAAVPRDLTTPLRKRLIDDNLSYKRWLVQQIERYLAEKRRKPK